MQEFSVPKAYGIILKICAVVFLGFVALGLATPFLPPIGHGQANEGAASTFSTAEVSITLAVMFGFAALLSWREGSRMSRATFVTDEDGIWPKNAGKKQGLVPWSAIAAMKDRTLLQRLDLFDSAGNRLLTIDYQISDFDTLKKIIYEKTHQSTPLTSQRTFRKGFFYHIVWTVIIVAIPGFFFALLHHFHPRFEYVVAAPMAALYLWIYIKQPFGMDIDQRSIVLVYPTGEKSIPLSDIEKVGLADNIDPENGNRIPVISLTIKNRPKPIKLNNVGVPNNVLYSVLRKTLEQI